MNIKNLSFLLAFACAVPVYADETAETQVTQEEKRNYAVEDACNSKMALAKMGMVAGALGGIATGIGGTAGATVSSVATGCALFALPVGVYAYLSNKYKNMFDKETYKRICDTEDKTFLYTMSALTAPLAVILVGSLPFISGYLGCGIGGIIGMGVGKIAAIAGIAKETAGVGALGVVSLATAILETREAEFKKQQDCEVQGVKYSTTLGERAYSVFGNFCKNCAYAGLIATAGAYAYHTA
jgi:hypothetical protein